MIFKANQQTVEDLFFMLNMWILTPLCEYVSINSLRWVIHQFVIQYLILFICPSYINLYQIRTNYVSIMI